MEKIRGAKELVHDAVEHTTNIVEEAHESVARKTMSYLDLFPPIAPPAHLVNSARKLISAGVFASIRGVNRAVEVVTNVAVEAAAEVVTEDGEESPVPMRSDSTGSWRWAGDTALGVVNGVIGDYLHDRENGLDLGMRLRYGDRYLTTSERKSPLLLPEATNKLVVFVHGVTCTEWSWSLKAEEYHGDPTVNFGTMLRRDLGYTPIYVRYNSGRHISENGRVLNERLDDLLKSYPQEVEELVLIGHSMGGLVVRSACHIAETESREWLSSLKKVVLIAAPHDGAPLEKFGDLATSILKIVDHPGAQIPAKVINARSAGIKDLRRGYLTEKEWRGRDPDDSQDSGKVEVPLLDGVAYCFIASTITKAERHPIGSLIGDMLVRLPSATGLATRNESFDIEVNRFGGIAHLELQNHPDVYEQLHRFCAGEAASYDEDQEP